MSEQDDKLKLRFAGRRFEGARLPVGIFEYLSQIALKIVIGMFTRLPNTAVNGFICCYVFEQLCFQ